MIRLVGSVPVKGENNIRTIPFQIFEEEHNVWFLDKGGALVAVKQPSVPTRHLWYVLSENLLDTDIAFAISWSYF